jgi:hypothetical protein
VTAPNAFAFAFYRDQFKGGCFGENRIHTSAANTASSAGLDRFPVSGLRTLRLKRVCSVWDLKHATLGLYPVSN